MVETVSQSNASTTATTDVQANVTSTEERKQPKPKNQTKKPKTDDCFGGVTPQTNLLQTANGLPKDKISDYGMLTAGCDKFSKFLTTEEDEFIPIGEFQIDVEKLIALTRVNDSIAQNPQVKPTMQQELRDYCETQATVSIAKQLIVNATGQNLKDLRTYASIRSVETHVPDTLELLISQLGDYTHQAGSITMRDCPFIVNMMIYRAIRKLVPLTDVNAFVASAGNIKPTVEKVFALPPVIDKPLALLADRTQRDSVQNSKTFRDFWNRYTSANRAHFTIRRQLCPFPTYETVTQSKSNQFGIGWLINDNTKFSQSKQAKAIGAFDQNAQTEFLATMSRIQCDNSCFNQPNWATVSGEFDIQISEQVSCSMLLQVFNLAIQYKNWTECHAKMNSLCANIVSFNATKSAGRAQFARFVDDSNKVQCEVEMSACEGQLSQLLNVGRRLEFDHTYKAFIAGQIYSLNYIGK